MKQAAIPPSLWNEATRQAKIEYYIEPENPLEDLLVAQPEWRKGAFWGDPRPGHPEGLILYHIKHVLDNVERCAKAFPEYRETLRLVTILHDTFKYKEETVRPRQDWSKHHAVYALRFAERFIQDQDVLDLVELHDEAYYVWLGLQAARPESQKMAEQRWTRLLNRLGSERLQLFYLFFKSDTLTGDKVLGPMDWFETRLEGQIQPLVW